MEAECPIMVANTPTRMDATPFSLTYVSILIVSIIYTTQRLTKKKNIAYSVRINPDMANMTAMLLLENNHGGGDCHTNVQVCPCDKHDMTHYHANPDTNQVGNKGEDGV